MGRELIDYDARFKKRFEETKDFWTNQLYLGAYDVVKDHKMPIVIPSYNNPDCFTVKLLNKFSEERDWPGFVVVRKSQEEEYKKYSGKVTVCAVEDELINSLGRARAWIVNEFSKNYDAVFMLDDDTQGVWYSIRGTTGEGKLKSEYQKQSDLPGVMAMWQLAHENVSRRSEKVIFSNISQCGFCYNDIFTDVKNSAMLLRGYPSLGCFAVNVKRLKETGMNYRHSPKIGHEDYDLYFRLLTQGYLNVQLAWIVCGQEAMHVGDYEAVNSVAERFKIQTEKLKKAMEPYNLPFVEYREVKGKYNSKITRSKLNKYLEDKGFLPEKMEIDIWDNGKLLDPSLPVEPITFKEKSKVEEISLW